MNYSKIYNDKYKFKAIDYIFLKILLFLVYRILYFIKLNLNIYIEFFNKLISYRKSYILMNST